MESIDKAIVSISDDQDLERDESHLTIKFKSRKVSVKTQYILQALVGIYGKKSLIDAIIDLRVIKLNEEEK